MKKGTVIARNETISELWRSARRIFLILFCVIPAISTLAQNRDTIPADTAKKFIIMDASTPSKKAARPLIVLNGKIYKRGIKTIDTTKIKSIDILKGKEAEALYGAKGKNGVVIITTKE